MSKASAAASVPSARAPALRPRGRRRWWIGLAAVVVGLIVAASAGGHTWLMNALVGRALARRDTAAAEYWLDWSRRLHCGDGETEMLKARLARRQNRMEDVRRFLAQAQQRGVPVRRLEREQWLALAQTGQMRDAEPHLEQLLLDPRDEGAEICEAYATGFLLAYRVDRVEALVSAWASDYPRDPLPHLIRARLARSFNGWKEAEAAYRRALERDPNSDEAQHGLADSLLTQQRPEDALDWYLRVPASSRHYVDARIGAADCLVALGRTAEAAPLLEQLGPGGDDNPKLLLTQARIDLEAGEYTAAAATLRRARTLQPLNDDILFALASALRGLGDAQGVKDVLAKAELIRTTSSEIRRLQLKIVESPADVQTRFQIGQHLVRVGRQSEAEIWFRSVLQLDPDHRGAQDALSAAAP